MANNLGQRDHGLNIPIQLGNISDAEKRALLSNINQIAKQMQGTLSDAISQEQMIAELRGALGKFNDMLTKFKVEPIELNVADFDNLSKMSKPFEELGRMAMDKFAKNFKMGDISGIISSDITDAINIVGGAIDKIYDKMEQGAKNSANNIAKSMQDIAAAAEKYSKKASMQEIDKTIRAGVKKDKAEQNVTGFLEESKSARKNGASWDEQYLADVKFVKNYEKVAEGGTKALERVFGDQFKQVEEYYNNLAKVHQQKIIALNDILAQNEFVGGTKKSPVQYQFKGGEPWAREKTLQEVKNILKGGLTVKGGSSNTQDEAPNLNTSKIEGDLNKTIELRMDAEKRAKEAAEKIAVIQEKMQKQGIPVYRGISEEEAYDSREEGRARYNAEYWSVDKQTALSYADSSEDDMRNQLLSAVAHPKKPMILDAEGHGYSDLRKSTSIKNTLKEIGFDMDALFPDWDTSPDEIQLAMNEFLTSKGYDAVITHNVKDANSIGTDGMWDDEHEFENNENAPITSTIAVLDDSILSTIQAFDVIEGVLQETATKIAEWYHAPNPINQEYADAPDSIQNVVNKLASLSDEWQSFAHREKGEKIFENSISKYDATDDQKAKILETLHQYQDVMSQIKNMPIVETEDDIKKLSELQLKAMQLQDTLRSANLQDSTIDSYVRSYDLTIDQAGELMNAIQADHRGFEKDNLDRIQSAMHPLYDQIKEGAPKLYDQILHGDYEQLKQHIKNKSNDTEQELETELAQLRQEQEAATKEIDKYTKKEEKQKKELEKIQSKLPKQTDGDNTPPSNADSDQGRDAGNLDSESIQVLANAIKEALASQDNSGDGEQDKLAREDTLSSIRELLQTKLNPVSSESPAEGGEDTKGNIINSESIQQLASAISNALTIPGDDNKNNESANDITLDGIKNILSSIIFKIKDVDANEPMDGLLHKLIGVDSDRERFAYINSRTGESSRYIEGTYSGISKASRQDLLKNSAGSWDSTLHTHPESIAAPSDDDIFAFVKHYAEVKKNFILAGEQLAEIDFTDIPFEKLQEFANKYRENVMAVDDDLQDKFENTALKDLGVESVNIDTAFSDIYKQLKAKFPELYKDIEVYISDLQSIFDKTPISNLSQFQIEDQIGDLVAKDFNGDMRLRDGIYGITKDAIDKTTGVPSMYQAELQKIFTQTIKEFGFDVSKIFKLHNVNDFRAELESSRHQDVSEKAPINSAIDQESINNLVGAIKTAITPQSDGESKSTAPWAKDETLRNITGKTLGKIANNIPKVDTKGLAKNDVLNRVAQATEAINKKISGRISGDINGPAAAQKSQLFDAKVQTRVSALQTKYTKLDASGQLTPEISDKMMGLWDDLDKVTTQPELSLWLQQLQQVENEIQQIITLNKLNEQETKDSVDEIIAVTKQYHDALIRAEKANNPELQKFWIEEANKAWAEQERLQQDIEAETGKRVDLTKQEIKLEQQLGAIRAEKAGKAKAAQEKKDLKDHNNAVQTLIDDYEELGRLRAQRDAMDRGSTERAALSQEIKSRSGKLSRQGQKLGVDLTKMKGFEDAARAEEDAAIATRKHKEEYDELIAKIKERNKAQVDLAGAKKDSEYAKGIQARVNVLDDEINDIKTRIKLTKEEQAEIDKLNDKRDNTVRNKQNKKQDQEDAKRFKEELKQARKDNNLDIANSRLTSARKALNDLWVLDSGIDPDAIPEVSQLRTELQTLRAEYDKVNQAMLDGDTDVEIAELEKTSAAVAEKTAKLKEMLAHYEKFKNGENIGTFMPGASSEEEQLRDAINKQFGGKAKIKGFERDTSGFLTASVEVKEGTRAFTEYKVAVEGADRSIRALKGNTRQLPSFLDSVKRKLGEISQYVSAMSLISRAGQELRKGIQYVRDIDLALTELKKVTDETEESYDKFLDTASKTAAKVGSTIKDVISSTADWARLNIWAPYMVTYR